MPTAEAVEPTAPEDGVRTRLATTPTAVDALWEAASVAVTVWFPTNAAGTVNPQENPPVADEVGVQTERLA
ncbi:MAG TPA: hypothetical protein VLY85_04510, partial [Thermoplasmata archaeon]|nr:hypothetical protein [Thermoplasmata archaeon]